ncbi:hypothetical protein [Caldimonas caldifontis]|mgnify:CR=1 FL=1|uniref:hypothetical protein n=1 Tax=Caldimonas caldifontis TaxID=1452508 RepID=UPI00268995B3
MSLSDSERLAIAAHLHVLMRRKLGRVTDTEWLAANWDYAQEILRVCRAEPDEELRAWADKLERAVQPLRPKPVPSAKAWADSVSPSGELAASAAASLRAAELQQRYIGRLR